MLQSQGMRVRMAHLPPLPTRCKKSLCGFPKGLDQVALPAHECASRFFAIQAVHLVAAVRNQRDRAPASVTSMVVTMKEELLGRVVDQPAVIRMRCQRPLAIPVRDYSERKTAPNEGREVPDHRAGLVCVGGSGVMDANEKLWHQSSRLLTGDVWPYRSSKNRFPS